ncbi:hypothetical protein GGR51DRAFT_478293 [Nemania sp. FL0031]|nr:hypothetical protein GGR51DRAFT_478293 [Nemania sp. FL0031]
MLPIICTLPTIMSGNSSFRAHEKIGFGTWSEKAGTIPITKEGELLGSLDITNPKHPVLRRPMGSVPLSDGSLSATLDTPIGHGSEHTDTILQPSNHAIDSGREIRDNFQEDLVGEGTEMGEHQSVTPNATEGPIIVSVGTHAQS